MQTIETIELILDDKEIKDMKTVVGSDKELKIYISPGGEEHIAWDDSAQKDIKTKTKKPDDWQYKVMRDAIERVGEEFGISLREVNKEKKSDTQIKVTTVPNADAVNGSWKRDSDGATDIYLSMTYQSGLDGSKYPDAHKNPDKYQHIDWERSEWKKIFIHELGHLIGLEHPWDKEDGDWAVKNSDIKTVDTIMGYESMDANGNIMSWFQDIDQRALREVWGAARNNQLSSINAGAGNDLITGGVGDDILKGGSGSDRLNGGAGNDKLIGGNGDDTLNGGNGNDKLIGGKGADKYILSAGKDTFISIRPSEGDVIEIDSSIPYSLESFRKHSMITHDEGSVLVKKVSVTDLETIIRIVD